MQLNKVDTQIKQCLLRYPSLFKSRMDVLELFFMTIGTGYKWDAHGCLVSNDREPVVQEMHFDDLDRRRAHLEESQAAEGYREGLAGFYASQSAQLKRQFAERRLIAEDIDVYATEHVMGENRSYGIERMQRFDPAFCLVAHAPFESLDPEWAAAAEETMSIARSAVWRHLEMHSEHFDRATADQYWLAVHDQLNELLNRLGAITGTPDRNANNLATLKSIALTQGEPESGADAAQ